MKKSRFPYSWRLAGVVFLVAILGACGARKQVGKQLPGGGAAPKDTPQRQACPPGANPTHTLTLTFTKPVPAKVGVRFPSDTNNYHMSECTVIAPAGLRVALSRPSANTLVVSIDNNGAYTDPSGVTTLPASQMVQIDDLHNCDTSTPTPLFRTDVAIPILWKVSYPAGLSCPPSIQGANAGPITGDGLLAQDEETPAAEAVGPRN